MVLATMSSRSGSCSRRVHGLWPSHLFSSLERASAPCRALAVPSPKNFPSPRQSISGWELNSLISQEVPDFERPMRKNIGTTSSVAPPLAGVGPARSPLASPPATGRRDPPGLASRVFRFREALFPLRVRPASRFRNAFMFRAISKAVRYSKTGTWYFLLSCYVATTKYDALTKTRFLLVWRPSRNGIRRRTVSPAHLDRLSRTVVLRRFEMPLGGVGEALVVYSDEELGRVHREALAGREELRRRSGGGRGRLERRPHRENQLRVRRQGLQRRVARLRGADPPLAQRAVPGGLDPPPRRR